MSLSEIIRNQAATINAAVARGNEDADETAARLLDAMARIIERKMLDLEQIHAAFGAPGDWGYSTPVGNCLARLYRGEES